MHSLLLNRKIHIKDDLMFINDVNKVSMFMITPILENLSGLHFIKLQALPT
jgi:hypothetical protein